MKTILIFLFCAAVYSMIPLKYFGVIEWSWGTVLWPGITLTVIIVAFFAIIRRIYTP